MRFRALVLLALVGGVAFPVSPRVAQGAELSRPIDMAADPMEDVALAPPPGVDVAYPGTGTTKDHRLRWECDARATRFQIHDTSQFAKPSYSNWSQVSREGAVCTPFIPTPHSATAMISCSPLRKVERKKWYRYRAWQPRPDGTVGWGPWVYEVNRIECQPPVGSLEHCTFRPNGNP
jgi:hypothetical protein